MLFDIPAEFKCYTFKTPVTNNVIQVSLLRDNAVFETNTSDIVFDTEWNTIEKLDEIVIQANIEKERVDKISKKFLNGRIDLFDDDDRIHTLELIIYLNTKSYRVQQDLSGQVSITRAGGRPAVF